MSMVTLEINETIWQQGGGYRDDHLTVLHRERVQLTKFLLVK